MKVLINKAFIITALLLTTLTQVALGSAAAQTQDDTAPPDKPSRRIWRIDSDPADTLHTLQESLDSGTINTLIIQTEAMNEQLQELLRFLLKGTFSDLHVLNIALQRYSLTAKSTVKEGADERSHYTLTYGPYNKTNTFSDTPHHALAKHLLDTYKQITSTGGKTKSARKS